MNNILYESIHERLYTATLSRPAYDTFCVIVLLLSITEVQCVCVCVGEQIGGFANSTPKWMSVDGFAQFAICFISFGISLASEQEYEYLFAHNANVLTQL